MGAHCGNAALQTVAQGRGIGYSGPGGGW